MQHSLFGNKYGSHQQIPVFMMHTSGRKCKFLLFVFANTVSDTIKTTETVTEAYPLKNYCNSVQ